MLRKQSNCHGCADAQGSCQLSVSLGRCRRRTNRRGCAALRAFSPTERVARSASQTNESPRMRVVAKLCAKRSIALAWRLDNHIATDLREGLISNSRDVPHECSLKPMTRGQRRDSPAVGRTNVARSDVPSLVATRRPAFFLLPRIDAESLSRSAGCACYQRPSSAIPTRTVETSLLRDLRDETRSTGGRCNCRRLVDIPLGTGPPEPPPLNPELPMETPRCSAAWWVVTSP